MKKIIAYIFIVLFYNCGTKPHPTIPTVEVDFYIYPTDLTYLNLSYDGGYVYVTGGVNGIIVYRAIGTEFRAYDRACPYDWTDSDAWISVEDNGIILSCSRCGATFNILDGNLLTGPILFSNPETYTLKSYRTYYNGMRLHVYN